MRYELTDLKLFLAIADAQNLSAGASAVHLTASAASYRLKNLETAMGTAMFSRNSRGMKLTPAGDSLLLHVRALFEGLECMHDDIGRFTSNIKGTVRLIANSSALNGFIMPSLGRFLALHPHVDVALEERQSNVIPAAVLAHESDIGIFGGQSAVEGLEIQRYAFEHMVIAAHPDHILSREPEITMAAALDFDFVCMERASSNFSFLRDIAQNAGRKLRVRVQAHDFEAVLSLVKNGVGLALVPRSVVVASRRAGDITTIPLKETWAARELNMAMRADARLPPFAQALVRILLDDAQGVMTREGRQPNRPAPTA